jgi:arginine utilization protein RocB
MFESYSEANGLPKREVNWRIEVLTLKDLINRLKSKEIDTEKIIEETLRVSREADMDARMTAFEIVEALQHADPEKWPRVILFYGAPFLPSNSLSEEDSRGIHLNSVLTDILEQTAANTGETFKVRNYFPYLADGSFMSFQGSDEDMEALRQNFPAIDSLFPLPLDTMTELNIPSINLGVFGKGGHKWTERVYKPYTFHVLPELIRNLTNRILK